jgi:hypothetical protein
MVARLALLACAAALVAFGLTRQGAHERCRQARVDALSIALRRSPATDAAAVARRIQADCRDVEELVNGAVVFARVDQLGPAARLADAAVRREPDRRNAWLALRAVRQAEGDASGAARALARARTLDPVGLGGRGSLNRSSGRSTR